MPGLPSAGQAKQIAEKLVDCYNNFKAEVEADNK